MSPVDICFDWMGQIHNKTNKDIYHNRNTRINMLLDYMYHVADEPDTSTYARVGITLQAQLQATVRAS
jgi:hypothetical protein